MTKRSMGHVMRCSLTIDQQRCQGFDGAGLAAMGFDQGKGQINRRRAAGARNDPAVVEVNSTCLRLGIRKQALKLDAVFNVNGAAFAM